MKINNITKIMIALMCGTAFSASAQMLDLIGSGAIGGAMMKGEIASVNRGMNTLKYTQLLQALAQNANIIRINYMGKYDKVKNSDVSDHILRSYNAIAGVGGASSLFYIELSNIDKITCKKLSSNNVGAKEVYINNIKGNARNCSDMSKIKFIFK